MTWSIFAPRRSLAAPARRAPRRPGVPLSLEVLENRLAPSAVRLAVIGNYGSPGKGEQEVANLVQNWQPDVIAAVGDNKYSPGSVQTIDDNVGRYYHNYLAPYQGNYGPGAATNRFFPAPGKHDWAYPGAQPYLSFFSMPNNGRYYDVTWGAVALFVLDSDPREPDGVSSTSTQAAWLKQELAASKATWKLVVSYDAPYSSATLDPSDPVLRWPFQAWGATAVLSGHPHDYERLVENGFPYFVEGLAGGDLGYLPPGGGGNFGPPVAGSQVRYVANYGAMLVTADQQTLTFQFFTWQNQLIDQYTLNAQAMASIPAVPSNLTATAVSASQIQLTWFDPSTNITLYRIERSTDGVHFGLLARVGPDAQSYADTGLAAGTVYYYRVRAVNGQQSSVFSNVASAFTLAAESGQEPF